MNIPKIGRQWVTLCHDNHDRRIDLLSMAILSNHFHLILRSRPDVVATWDDNEVARRWLLLCPKRGEELFELTNVSWRQIENFV